MKLSTFKEAEEYLNQYIPKTSKWGEPSFAFARSQYLTKLLGDPQNKLKVIHIAGTSGKGSTAYITSKLLSSQGLKTGMGISPHVQHLMERIQINNSLISEELFVEISNETIPSIEEMKTSEFGQATFFEILVGLSYYIFLKEKVDVVVMETGLGGRYCATNTVTREDKISVITRIGFDHMEFLGNTLPLISTEKAKIIQPKNLALKLDQEQEVMKVFEKEASEKKAQLVKIQPDQIITERTSTLFGLKFNFSYKDIQFEDLHVSLIGEYQFENAAIALISFVEFMKRESRSINEEQMRNFLSKTNIPGRMEMKHYKGKELLIDGAHNPQKMEAFIKSLTNTFRNEKFTFLISFKKGKEYEPILKYIIPHAQEIIVTSFENRNQGMGELYSEDPKVIGEILYKLNFFSYKVIPNLQEAFASAQESNKMIVITGSLYLIGEMYNIMEK